MKTLYLDCSMGVAGDMLMAALLELSSDPSDFVHTINHLGIPGVSVFVETVSRHGTSGTHIKVIWNDYEEQGYDMQTQEASTHSNMENECGSPFEMESLLTSLPLSRNIKENALAVMKLIFESESHVHGIDMIDIHDSRLGTMDAIMDVIGCCMLIDQLAPEKIVASSVHVGYGQICTLRGMLPIPAPATEYLLRDIPYYTGEIQGEFCTPTGAALIRHFVDFFAPVRDMVVAKMGCGIGSKNFGISGGLQVYYGDFLAVS